MTWWSLSLRAASRSSAGRSPLHTGSKSGKMRACRAVSVHLQYVLRHGQLPDQPHYLHVKVMVLINLISAILRLPPRPPDVYVRLHGLGDAERVLVLLHHE